MKTNRNFSFCCSVVKVFFAAALVCFFVACDKQQQSEELSENISLVTQGNKQSLVNTSSGQTLIEDISVDWVCTGRDSLAVFAKDDKRGYFNIHTGEIVVPLTYKHAWVFSEGLAGVVQNDMVGFINSKGDLVIPCRYPYRGNSLTEFVFNNGHCVVANEKQQIGVIDTLGNWVIKPIYDNVNLTREYAVVYAKGQFKQQVDFSGNVLNSRVIDYVSSLYFPSNYINKETGEPESGSVENEKYAKYRVGEFYGLMSTNGRVITLPIYADIIGISESLFMAQLKDYDSMVLINAQGEIISR